jgi:eukaryotic-like serine/threonine-protein kinase
MRERLTEATAGRFEILREVGRGGMGAVYLARDLSLDREVAIKVLPPELAAQPTLRERFVREARLAASLSHPNIIHVHSVEEHHDLLAFVMQYVDGETLTERIARSGPYDAADCAQLLQDVAWALGYAHGRGVVHRDVKPDNLLIERGTGRPMILDFGIARQDRASGLTEVGHSIGTPRYMSPEQAAAEGVDGRSDLYSLGCVGFFAATGRPPFDGESAHKLLMQHLTVPAPAVTSVRPEFPSGLSDVIATALAKEPGARFATGEAMAEAIGRLQLRTREVAPLLRLFQQQTAQALQTVLALGAVFTVFMLTSGKASTLFGSVFTVLAASMALTILGQALDRVRFVVRQGFTIDDVRAAITAMSEDTARARELLLADPVESRRIRRRKFVAIVGTMVAGGQVPILPRYLRFEADGDRTLPLAAILMVLSISVLVGVSLALWTARPVRVTLAQRVANRVWMSAVGSRVFARAQRRYAAELRRPGPS